MKNALNITWWLSVLTLSGVFCFMMFVVLDNMNW